METKERMAREIAEDTIEIGETNVTLEKIKCWSVDDLYEWLELGWGLEWDEEKETWQKN